MRKSYKLKGMVLATCLGMSLTACGMTDRNTFVDEVNEINDKIAEMEQDSIEVANAFAVDPTKSSNREDYLDTLSDLAELYSEYGNQTPIEDVVKEHKAVVEKGEEIAQYYLAMVEVLSNEEIEFDSEEGVTALIEEIEGAYDVSKEFLQNLDDLIDALNK